VEESKRRMKKKANTSHGWILDLWDWKEKLKGRCGRK